MAGSGRFNFDDGGSFCGGWYAGMAEGYAVCSGPHGEGVYAGTWFRGFEVSGTYKWPNGDMYEGEWKSGKRDGLGVERCGDWLYRGEWTCGCKNGYGVRLKQGSLSRYEGIWSDGLYDGYGCETYGDGGTYEGQWQQGLRQGFGVRTSAPYADAVKYCKRRSCSKPSSTSRQDSARHSIRNTNAADRVNTVTSKRGGFTLSDRKCTAEKALQRSMPDLTLANSKEQIVPIRRSRSELRLKPKDASYEVQQMMTSMIGSMYSSSSSISSSQDELNEQVIQSSITADRIDDKEEEEGGPTMADLQLDDDTIECYMGQWRNDKRTGFGVCERSDGLKYEGQWVRNRKNGYGVTTYKDGSVEKGKYKENVFVTMERRSGLLSRRRRIMKHEHRAAAAVELAHRAARLALQKREFVVARVDTANERAEMADEAAEQAYHDSKVARNNATEIDAEFLSSVDRSNVQRAVYRYHADVVKKDEAVNNRRIIELDSQSTSTSKSKWRLPKASFCCYLPCCFIPCSCSCFRFPKRIIREAVNKVKLLSYKLHKG